MFARHRRFISALCLIGLFSMVPWSQDASAHKNMAAPNVLKVPGPFTFRGRVLDPQGRPLAGYPLRLLPVLPKSGVDDDNLVYKIPGRDEHRTVTDELGRFVMTGVVHYPQVSTMTYRIQGNWDFSKPFFDLYGCDVIPLTDLTSQTLELVIRTEPAATLKLTLRDGSGRAFSGTRAVSVTTAHYRRVVRTAHFTDGVSLMYLPPGDAENPGRVALLRWANSRQAKEQALAQGHELSLKNPILYGVVAQKDVLLLPGQTSALEFRLMGRP